MSFIVSIDINRVVGTTKKNREKNVMSLTGSLWAL